jgi:hypothetical protein
MTTNTKSFWLLSSALLALLIFWGNARYATAATPLRIKETPLQQAFFKQPYRFQLQAEGGIQPVLWRLERGSLPPGVHLEGSGLIQGVPGATGEFHFTVVVTDSGRPPFERRQALTLTVIAPLFAQWDRYPKVSGRRVDGSIKVSNGKDKDFDLTFVVLAVNEIGRATAIGYQHFTLKKGMLEMEIPFGDELSRGSYQINVDVVGEVAADNAIYRTRLVTSKNLEVTQGP